MSQVKLSGGSFRKDIQDAITEIEDMAERPGFEAVAVVVLGQRTRTVRGRHARDNDQESVQLDIVQLEFALTPEDTDILRRVAEALHRKNTSAGTLEEGSAEGLALKHAEQLIGDDEG